MNTVRGRALAAFVRDFTKVEGRGPTAEECCKVLQLTRAQLTGVVKRLLRQGVIGQTVLFEPRAPKSAATTPDYPHPVH